MTSSPTVLSCQVCLSWQGEVVRHGFGVTVIVVAHLCSASVLPSRMGCNSMKRVLMGDTCRYRNDTSKLKHVFSSMVFGCVCVCFS